VPPTSIPSR